MASALKQAKELSKYNNKLDRENVKLQYQYNKALAEQDRSWQERMSNSAHQREIKDLKAAGLNPVLSVTGGNGASTPSGSSASVSKADTDMSLPGKVMDMAMAQLNSATNLQIASMQTAASLRAASINAGAVVESSRISADVAWRMHNTTSGSTWLGQLQTAFDDALPKYVKKLLKTYSKYDTKYGWSAKGSIRLYKRLKAKYGRRVRDLGNGYYVFNYNGKSYKWYKNADTMYRDLSLY